MSQTTFSGPVRSLNGFISGSSGTQLSLIQKGSVTVVVAALTAGSEADVAVTVAGALAGDSIVINPPNSAMETGLGIAAVWVSASNTVSIRMSNFSGSTLTGSSTSWSYVLIRS